MRTKLSRDLKAWQKIQLQRYPKLRKHIPLVDITAPQDETFQLPSDFTSELRRSLDLDKLAKIEYELREGQAHDALSALRQSIQEYNHNLLDKRNNIYGTRENMRSQSFFKTLNADKLLAAEQYRGARAALLSLGLPEDDDMWKKLDSDQLWGRSVSTKRKLNESSKEDPWFWSVVKPRNLSDDQEKEWSRDSKSSAYLPSTPR